MFFISDALAQAAPAAATAPSLIGNIVPLVLIGAIFYFLIIRPQNVKLKTHQTMVAELKKGDEIVTGGGIIGKIKKTEDAVLTVEIAPGVDVKINRHSVLEKTK